MFYGVGLLISVFTFLKKLIPAFLVLLLMSSSRFFFTVLVGSSDITIFNSISDRSGITPHRVRVSVGQLGTNAYSATINGAS